MSFRARIAVGSAAAVALSIVAASILVYVIARDQLRAPVDAALRDREAEILTQPSGSSRLPTERSSSHCDRSSARRAATCSSYGPTAT